MPAVPTLQFSGTTNMTDSKLTLHQDSEEFLDRGLLASTPFAHTTIYTGNTMQTGTTGLLNASLQKSNQELVSALEETLLYSIDTATIKGQSLIVRDSTSIGRLEEDRSKYEITAKLFLLPQDNGSAEKAVGYIASSLQELENVVGSSKVDHFILSLPNQVFDEADNDIEAAQFSVDLDTYILPIWARLEQLRKEGRIQRLGVAEFSKQQLIVLKSRAQSQGPEFNQVNLQDCCVLPKDLIEYAKKEQIELLTHGDSNQILPKETFQSLVQPYIPAAAHTLTPSYVLKYSAFITSRGLITHKGYIISAGARC